MRWMVVAALTLWLGATAASAQPPSTLAWQDAAGYLRLFAPSGPRAAAYRIFVTPLAIDAVLARLSHDVSLLHPPGSWSPAAVLPADAFGQTGAYDRTSLARLYGARRPMVARGPRGVAGRPTEAWTLISPYPNRELRHLERGTMLIVLDLEWSETDDLRRNLRNTYK